VVVAGVDCLAGEHSDLDRIWLCLVEDLEIVVRAPLTLRKPNAQTRRAKDIADLENEVVSRLAELTSPTTESIRNVRRNLSKQIADSPPHFIVSLALNFVRHGVVPRFVAYELIQHHPAAARTLEVKLLEDLGSANKTWGEVDAFACYLAGPAWREHQVDDDEIKRWARSEDRWWRRTALVCTVALNNKARGGRGDSGRTVMICELLAADRDDMVVKALSWALRELSKRDPQTVGNFVKQHQDVLARRVVREVNSKLRTGMKNPRRQSP
jgi:3-methyladenine DNA glycosylase AlkD